MIQIAQNSIFIDDLKESIQEILEKDNVELGEQRIIVTIDSDGVKTKIVTPLPKKARVSKRPPEVARRIQEAKKILKGRQDLICIFTLLISLENELKKFDVSQLSQEGRDALLPEITKINANLTGIIKGVKDK